LPERERFARRSPLATGSGALQNLPGARKQVSGTFSRNGPEGASQKEFLTPFSDDTLH
jgi:hypothetical protein